MKPQLFSYFPIAIILAWWLHDLQVQWRNLSEYHYGWIVPLLVAYLVWDKWSSFPDDGPTSVWIPFAFASVGTPFVLLAELYKQAIAQTPASSFCLSIGCGLFIVAILYLHGRKTVLHFLFPLFFLFLAVPIPGILWNVVVLALKEGVTTLTVEFLNFAGIPAVQSANVIQLANCAVGVDDACSGVRSLQSSVMIALFIGNLAFRKLRSRMVFVLTGVCLAVIGNLLRSLFLAVSVHQRGIEALDQFHDGAGWSIFVFTTSGLAGAAWLISKFERRINQGHEIAEEPVRSH